MIRISIRIEIIKLILKLIQIKIERLIWLILIIWSLRLWIVVINSLIVLFYKFFVSVFIIKVVCRGMLAVYASVTPGALPDVL